MSRKLGKLAGTCIVVGGVLLPDAGFLRLDRPASGYADAEYGWSGEPGFAVSPNETISASGRTEALSEEVRLGARIPGRIP